MKVQIVVGTSFGDEGKGALTKYLCKEIIAKDKKPLVIRYGSGHQCGHTVERKDGTRHTFQSFGSGTMEGAATFWSKYCVMFPIGFTRELADLRKLKVEPKIFFDPEVAVTTYYDVFYNQATELHRDGEGRHGSVGVGIGATYERHETPYKLFFNDLYYPEVLNHKLDQISEYYKSKSRKNPYIKALYDDNNFDEARIIFLKSVSQIIKNKSIKIKSEKRMFHFNQNTEYIFEGAQGILLDQSHGFFPNVTRANTTSKNAIEIINRNPELKNKGFEIQYITRIYSTRHGEGFFPTSGLTGHLIPELADKTNFLNPWQGNFRYGCLDLRLMKYAIECDQFYYDSTSVDQTLNISCLDHLKSIDKIQIKTTKGEIKDVNYKRLIIELDMVLCPYQIKTSDNPYSEFILNPYPC